MTQTARAIPALEPEPTADQRVILHGVSWSEYETILAIRDRSSRARIAYLEGELELMSPSRDHEVLAATLGRLLIAYAEERGIELESYRSMTMRKRRRARGVEADDCYAVGGPKKHPDLAIEVVWTSGGLEKLEIYRGLGVREVWVWERGELGVYVLYGERYRRAERSKVLPDLDIDLLMSFTHGKSQTQAVRAYRAALRRKR